jgi:ATP-dependent helicase/DNAse subunit B
MDTDKSNWTIDTLKEYVLALIDANDKKYTQSFEEVRTATQTALTAQKLAVDTALIAADRAGEKAERAGEKRLDGLNELRNMASDAQANYMQRLEADAKFKALEDKADAIRESLTKEIAGLRESRSESSGKSLGASALWAYLFAFAGIALALIFHFIK